MARFTLKIDLDNAAFAEPDELPRILHTVADRLAANPGMQTASTAAVRDVNGNMCGAWKVRAR